VKNSYEAKHVEDFLQIAEHVSLAIEKSQLFDQVKEEREKMQGLLLRLFPPKVVHELLGDKFPIAFDRMVRVFHFSPSLYLHCPVKSAHAQRRLFSGNTTSLTAVRVGAVC
jgi:hypothetical protein